MRAKIQRGYIYEAACKFYVRYFETVRENGEERRVHKSRYLCDKGKEHPHRKAQSVKLLAAQFMMKVNGGLAYEPKQRVTIVEFWEEVYLLFIEKHRAPATVYGYKKVWSTHLKAHFGQTLLTEYRTPMASQFLTTLAEQDHGSRSLSKIRSLSSGIFSHAVNLGRVDSNPWRDAKPLGKVKATPNTAHYTLEQVENIVNALVGHLDLQLIVALAFFLGLRPSEIAGLQWGDIREGWLFIRRSVWHGIVGATKTPESAGSLPLISPVKEMMAAWRVEKANPTDESFVFGNGKPVDLDTTARWRIKPLVEAKGLAWKGLYAGRRGAGTILTQLTGDALAAQQILRHKNLSMTTLHYVKQIPTAGLEGMKLLEAAAAKK